MDTTSPPFEHLLAAHAARVHRAALGLMGEEQEAREAAQASLLKAWRARERYDARRPFYPWLYRIVKNTCLDARARRRHRALPGLEPERHGLEQADALQSLGQRESIAQVRRGLDRLSDEHREIIAMRHFQDLSYAEIGELLGLPQGTVMSRLYRARKALVRALEEER